MKKNKKKGEKKRDLDAKYPHNPGYCMILPDADKPKEEDISSTGQS